MSGNGTICFAVCLAILCVGAVGCAYQIYQMVLIDAKARGLKHPAFWGFFAINGNNSSGLLMYLLGRKKYPLLELSDCDRRKIAARKKAAGVGLIFLATGAIGLVLCLLFL